METSEVTLKKVPAIKVISTKGKGLAGEAMSKLIGALVAQVMRPENAENNVVIAGPPMFIPHYNDSLGDFNPKKAIFEVAFPISVDPVVLDPGFEVYELPKSKVLSMTCTGPYEEFSHELYAKLFEHAGEEGYEVVGPVREIYVSNPEETPADQLETELQLPVA